MPKGSPLDHAYANCTASVSAVMMEYNKVVAQITMEARNAATKKRAQSYCPYPIDTLKGCVF